MFKKSKKTGKTKKISDYYYNKENNLVGDKHKAAFAEQLKPPGAKRISMSKSGRNQFNQLKEKIKKTMNKNN